MSTYNFNHNAGLRGVRSGSRLAESRTAVFGTIALAYLTGMGSFLVWLFFLVNGPLNLVPLPISETGIIGLDVGLSLLFFIVHSGMIRVRFRLWLGRFVGEAFHNALYTIVSGLVLFAVTIFWQASTIFTIDTQAAFRWAMYVLIALSLGGIYVCTRAFEEFDMCGVAPLRQLLRNDNQPADIPFTVRGPYRWVRHPFYLFSILLIWASPHLTADRLLFNVMWTAWVIVGAMFEERDLVARFGDLYRNYRNQVPMLFPKSLRPVVPVFISGDPGVNAQPHSVYEHGNVHE